MDNDNQGPPAKVQKRDKDSAKEEQEHGVECGDDDKEQVLTTTGVYIICRLMKKKHNTNIIHNED